jgi:hypothetical protein
MRVRFLEEEKGEIRETERTFDTRDLISSPIYRGWFTVKQGQQE